jgi:hypothetical protein
MAARRYTLTAYENDGPNRFSTYKAGDHLVEVGAFCLVGGDINEALEAFWAVGNKVGADADGRIWPRTRRSMSTGDVVAWGKRRYFANFVGWKPVKAK